MVSFEEMFEILSKYLTADKLLEIGFSNAFYTKIFAKTANSVMGIDLSKDFMKIAKKEIEGCENITLKIMDASQLDFESNYFDVVASTSFHEVDPKIQLKVLEEMYRVSKKPKTFVFIEPDVDSVTNELFTVFDPNENHAERIKNSFDTIFKFVNDNQLEVKMSGKSNNTLTFNSKDELTDEMLNWWADIKVPANEEEKEKMVTEISSILDNRNMLNDLTVSESIQFYVFGEI